MKINGFDDLTFGTKYPRIPASELVEKLEQNMTHSQIAKEYNIPRHALEKSMRRVTLDSFNEVDNNVIIKLYKKGFSVKKIKNLFGYSQKQIQLAIDFCKSNLKSKDLVSSIIKNLNLNPSVLKDLK